MTDDPTDRERPPLIDAVYAEDATEALVELQAVHQCTVVTERSKLDDEYSDYQKGRLDAARMALSLTAQVVASQQGAEKDDDSGRLTCPNDHTHAVEEMDHVGMDYQCPECEAVVRPHE